MKISLNGKWGLKEAAIFAVALFLAVVTFLALLTFLGTTTIARGDDNAPNPVTYSKDIAPIMFQHCAECHRPGEAAPMNLLSYEDTRPWVKSIKKNVVSRKMPPWSADPHYGKFINDISLPEEKIKLIADWVDQGAPLGDAKEVPPVPQFKNEWKLGAPDYIVELPEYSLPASGPDQFPNLSAKINLPKDVWIQSLEFLPGNRRIVHHIVLYRGEGGMMSSGGSSQDGLGTGAFSGWAVGTPPVTWPEGMGHELKKDDTITANMHYHPSGKPETDRTRIGFYFGKGEIKKIMWAGAPLRLDFLIPAGAENFETSASINIEDDIYVTQYFPHMHQRGKDMKYTAIFPDGRREVMLSVPNYDFNWQWNYYLEKPLFLPKGSKVEILSHHDNSAKNPNNPDPTKDLWFGEESNNEMMIGAFAYYVAEGKRPKPWNANADVERFLAEKGGDTFYRLYLAPGTVPLPMVLNLPREGKGADFMALPGEVISTLPVPVEWKGNDFRLTIPIGEMGKIIFSGTLKEDGKIAGKMETDNVFGNRGDRVNRHVEFVGVKKGGSLKTASAK